MNQFVTLVSNRKTSYYNKIVFAPKSTVNGYKDMTNTKIYQIPYAVNFNPNDNLSTKLVVNVDSVDIYNYLLVTKEDQSAVVSRWFILGSKRIRVGQFELSLIRDAIADNYSGFLDSNIVLKRSSYIAPQFSEAQYKKTMTFNQIKTSETLLGEADGCEGYLVIYSSKDISSQQVFAITAKSGEAYQVTDTVMKDIIEHSGSASGFAKILNCGIQIESYILDANQYPSFIYTFNDASIFNTGYPANTRSFRDYSVINGVPHSPYSDNSDLQALLESYANKEATYTLAKKYMTEKGVSITDDTIAVLDTMDGKTIYSTSYNPKTLHIEKMSTPIYSNLSTEDRTAVATALKFDELKKADANRCQFFFNIVLYKVTLEDAPTVNTGAYASPFPTDRMTTKDSVYNVDIIPVGGKIKIGEKQFSVNRDTMFSFVAELMKVYATGASGEIYDIQWLPYGYDNQRFSSDILDVSKCAGTGYTIMTAQQEKGDAVGVILHCSKATVGMTVYKNIIASNSSDLMENRITNETTFYRLCSPNWTSTFEFKSIYNNGLKGFNIDVTFKPYTPYIRVCPIFENLYGGNFNDTRGLVLSGDFSIDQTSSAWVNYKLNNKNYELIFNRDIQSLDLQNSVADVQDRYSTIGNIFSTATGTIQAGAMGTMLSGGNVAVGAVAGVASLGAGVADTIMQSNLRGLNKSIRSDNRQASIDKYQYQLGNIKAMPTSLTKTSSFDKSYRVYPILEKYTCTDEEASRLRESIEINGIDIDKYCTPNTAKSGKTSGIMYMTASMVRWNGNPIPENEITAINDILNDGVYWEVG